MCSKRGPFFLSRRLSANDCLYTSWTEYISNHNITFIEKGRPERDHERFDSCWFAFARLPYRSLSLRLSERQTRTRWAPWIRGCFLASTRYNFSAHFKRPIHFGPRHSFLGLVSNAVQSAKRAIGFSSHSSRCRRPLCPDRWSVRCQNVLAAQFRDIHVSFGLFESGRPARIHSVTCLYRGAIWR